MRAAVLREYGRPLTIEDVAVEGPRAGEVRVRIEASGVCHSDVATALGHIPNPLPVVLGHEGAGVVEEVGAGVTSVRPGDRVMLSWAPECKECFYCRTGRPNLCAAYAPKVLDGGLLDGTCRMTGDDGAQVHHYSFLSTFAEQAIVPESSCIRLDGDISARAASLIGCAVMTGYGAAVKSGRVMAGDNVIVLGAGGVGVNAIQGARIAGARRIIAADALAEKEATARAYGATHFIDVGTTDVAEASRDLTGGLGADVVIEASGHPASIGAAYDLARRGGTIVFVGVAPVGARLEVLASRLPREEKIITGSFYGGAVPALDFQQIVDHYVAGRLLLDEQIERVGTLDEINDLIQDKPQRGVRNVVAFD